MAQTLDTLKTKTQMADQGDTVNGVCLDAVAELQRACKKFPKFPDEFTSMTPAGVENYLANMRRLNYSARGENANADTVIQEEYYEFVEAVVDRDPAKARKELVQTIAMLLRTYIHLEHYCRPV